MRVVVMGTGGLGGFFGGLLARAGHDVLCVARGPHLEAMREHGLTVKSSRLGDFTVPLAVTDNPASFGPADLVLFCVKTYDLDQAARLISPVIGPSTVVVPVQNGVDAADRLAAILGGGPVLGGISYVGGSIVEPGVVAEGGAGQLVFGEVAGGTSPRVERLQAIFEAADLPARIAPDVVSAIWQKFLVICAASAVTTLTRLPLGGVLDCPETLELMRGLIEEAVAVGRRRGARPTDDASDRTIAALRSLEPSRRTSLYYDMLAGRRLELESLNGTVVRLGRELGIPTPLNFAVYAALKPYVDGPPAVQ